jgi:hypothetical protein
MRKQKGTHPRRSVKQRAAGVDLLNRGDGIVFGFLLLWGLWVWDLSGKHALPPD